MVTEAAQEEASLLDGGSYPRDPVFRTSQWDVGAQAQKGARNQDVLHLHLAHFLWLTGVSLGVHHTFV